MKPIPSHYLAHIRQQQNFSEQTLENFIRISTKPLRKSIRAVSHKSSVADLRSILTALGLSHTPIAWSDEGLWLDHFDDDKLSLGNLIHHLQGRFYIQEASSMLPVEVITRVINKPDALILDMAAAPGSKTTQVAAALPDSLVVANEISSSRIKSLAANIQRCGLSNVVLTHHDGRKFGDYAPQLFDAVLLDAPCGGEGTIRKDPNALDNWSLEALESISSLQKSLIVSAFRATKPGGLLVYSTCTLSKEENQHVCGYLLKKYNDIETVPLNDLFDGAEKCCTEEGYLHVFPHIFDSEGFFVAAFRKSDSASRASLLPAGKLKEAPSTKSAHKLISDLEFYLLDQFGFKLNRQRYQWESKNEEIWLVHRSIDQIVGHITWQRNGTPVANKLKKGFRLYHDFAVAFGHCFSKGKVDINSLQTEAYYKGRDIPFDNLSKRDYLLTYENRSIGFAKYVGNRLKNNLPRYLVRDNAVGLIKG